MDKLTDLATRIRAKRESGSHPYVLVLGAGASVSSGTSLNRAVVERIIGTYDLPAFDQYLRGAAMTSGSPSCATWSKACPRPKGTGAWQSSSAPAVSM